MITAEEPKVTTTGRYSVMQTCAILGIHRNSLLKYTKDGLITCGFRKINTCKFYLGSEILKFWRAHL